MTVLTNPQKKTFRLIPFWTPVNSRETLPLSYVKEIYIKDKQRKHTASLSLSNLADFSVNKLADK
jgi:hypothetical protein